ncbi:pseudouridine synthase [Vibrio sp. FNV 38]|nr:pseudouridine synthase [Vibrio sp. FNV 38]
MPNVTPALFTPLNLNQDSSLPQRFTFPYYYTPHPISQTAVEDLQQKLTHNGIDQHATGHLYAVLVVEHQDTGNLGYLSAFSGQALDQDLQANASTLSFVPSVFNLSAFNEHYAQQLKQKNLLTQEIALLAKQHNLVELAQQLENQKLAQRSAIEQYQQRMAENKAHRNALRIEAEKELTSEQELNVALKQMANQSSQEKRELKALRIQWKNTLADTQQQIEHAQQRIESTQSQYQALSKEIESLRLTYYSFINKHGEEQTLLDLLHGQPAIENSGDCCLPKLLNYAFSHQLKPLATAEFWWGCPPKQEIRQHGNFYPVCQSKCFEIIEHQLTDIALDDNPLIVNPAVGKSFDIVYEDNDVVVVNKPAEFLSVPGKFIEDSIYTRIKARYPDATGPLIIHRLDMSTSGLLVLALNSESNKHIQKQFIERKVDKRYTALLDGTVIKQSGDINLPMRGDITDRPRQLVCDEHGRHAETHWQVIERRENQTLVYLYPKTGRTHQLRVHCAHPNGLGVPISGDDLYGFKRDRLHLHAGYIKFIHPRTGESMEFEVPANF